MTHDQISEALQGLCPGAVWTLSGSAYAGITWLDTVQTQPTEAAVAAYVAPPSPSQVLSQDIMAQFTAADATLIQTAVNSNVQFWLLWSAFQTQSDPMIVTNARFLAGWSALTQVLGAPRMAAIATALGITVA